MQAASLAGLNPKPNDIIELINREKLEISRQYFSGDPWVIQSNDEHKAEAHIESEFSTISALFNCAPLRGILSGLNDAYYIDQRQAENLLSKNQANAAFIKPMIRGRDVERWRPASTSSWHIVLQSSANQDHPWAACKDESEAEDIFSEALPDICHHLMAHKDKLKKRADRGKFWWELRSCDYYSCFEEGKILAQCIAFHSRFCIDTSQSIVNNKVILLPSQDKCLLAYLNSSLCWWILHRRLVPMKDGGLSIDANRLKALPAPSGIRNNQEISESVSNLLEVLKAFDPEKSYARDVIAIENNLDRLIMEASLLPGYIIDLIRSTPPDRDPLHIVNSSYL